jgi:hypothetical protein
LLVLLASRTGWLQWWLALASAVSLGYGAGYLVLAP